MNLEKFEIKKRPQIYSKSKKLYRKCRKWLLWKRKQINVTWIKFRITRTGLIIIKLISIYLFYILEKINILIYIYFQILFFLIFFYNFSS